MSARDRSCVPAAAGPRRFLGCLALGIGLVGSAVADDLVLRDDAWELATIPGDAGSLTVSSLFGDDPALSPSQYDVTWKVFLFDRSLQDYVDAGIQGTLEPGAGFWIIQRSGATVQIPLPTGVGSVSSNQETACASASGCFDVDLTTVADQAAFTMVGAPYDDPIDVADIRIAGGSAGEACFEGCTLAEANQADIAFANLFAYDSSIDSYVDVGVEEVIGPWKGFWMATPPDAEGALPRVLLPSPATAEACEFGSSPEAQCPLPGIVAESSPFDVKLAPGASSNFSSTFSFETVFPDEFSIVIEQEVTSGGASTTGISLSPAIDSGFSANANLAVVENQVIQAQAEGVYEISTTATIVETDASSTSTVRVTVTAEADVLLASVPGVAPATLPPDGETAAIVSVIVQGADRNRIADVAIQGDGFGELRDDGEGADLLGGDGTYTGLVELDSSGIAAGECLVLRANVSLGGSTSVSDNARVCVSALPSFVAPPAPGTPVVSSGADEPVLSNEIVIEVAEGASDGEIEAIAASIGGSVAGSVPELRSYQIRLSSPAPSYADLVSVIDALETQPLVVSASANGFASTEAVTPNDPRYGAQSHLVRIRADEAWAIARGGSLVAVVDTGVDLDHPDLEDRIAGGINVAEPGTPPDDPQGHGTHVAGIVAARSNNGVGVSGVAWDSKILPVKVTAGASGSTTSLQLASGIVRAANAGARIVNVSMSSPSSNLLCKAVVQSTDKGAIVVGAAGNYDSTLKRYPAACAGAVAVANTTSSDARQSNSNYGDWISLSAPGTGILSTTVGGQYGPKTGTSMAAPVVAGSLAVLLSREPLTNAEAITRLERTAAPLGDSTLGAGRVDLFEAVFNGSFEEGNLALWTSIGTSSSKTSLANVITPRHRERMGSTSTGPAGSQVQGTLFQSFTIEPGVTSFPVSFEYAFVSEEFPEFVDTQFDDALRIYLVTPEGAEITLAEESVNRSVFTPISGIDFPEGDGTVGWTGWKSSANTISVTAGAGEYRIFLEDAGDSVYDTEVLVDNIRFR